MFDSKSTLNQEFSSIVQELQRHLLWQRSCGWKGVSLEPGEELYQIVPPIKKSKPSYTEFSIKEREIKKAESKELRGEYEYTSSGTDPSRLEKHSKGWEPPASKKRPVHEKVDVQLVSEKQRVPFPALRKKKGKEEKEAPKDDLQVDGGSVFARLEKRPPTKPSWLRDFSEGAQEKLQQLRHELGDCRKCSLSKGRKSIVYGAGSANSRIVLVGMSPNEDDERDGIPFRGSSGELLSQMLRSIGLDRRQVYVLHLVKCCLKTRLPNEEELLACRPYWQEQIDAIRPEFIITLGALATQHLLQTDEQPRSLWGRWHTYQGAHVLPLHSPDYLIRNPQEKGKAWKILLPLMKELQKERT